MIYENENSLCDLLHAVAYIPRIAQLGSFCVFF